MKLYEIADDVLAINNLFDKMVDENGEPREPTEEEIETLKKWFEETEKNFKIKFDNYCRFLKNLKLSAQNADAERKNFKSEIDRLAKRAKAFENRADCIRNLLWYQMERLNMTAMKTDLFSAGVQNTQIKVSLQSGADTAKIPDKFFKPREIDTAAVKDAIKSGELVMGTGKDYAKLFDKDGSEIAGLMAVQGKTLVIR